jgi:hypothetical protein
MSRKVGQIIARGERRWLVRVYLGRDRETRKRTYHNRTIYASLRHAQAYLTRRLHERDLSAASKGSHVTEAPHLSPRSFRRQPSVRDANESGHRLRCPNPQNKSLLR